MLLFLQRQLAVLHVPLKLLGGERVGLVVQLVLLGEHVQVEPLGLQRALVQRQVLLRDVVRALRGEHLAVPHRQIKHLELLVVRRRRRREHGVRIRRQRHQRRRARANRFRDGHAPPAIRIRLCLLRLHHDRLRGGLHRERLGERPDGVDEAGEPPALFGPVRRRTRRRRRGNLRPRTSVDAVGVLLPVLCAVRPGPGGGQTLLRARTTFRRGRGRKRKRLRLRRRLRERLLGGVRERRAELVRRSFVAGFEVRRQRGGHLARGGARARRGDGHHAGCLVQT
mmetsp:Transcript_12591/g.52779  ORF Transcript_12591/g.52779 Transcript_12591/m.52779 type:complete len:282 (+) Transcript_12591:812-1657(+)